MPFNYGHLFSIVFWIFITLKIFEKNDCCVVILTLHMKSSMYVYVCKMYNGFPRDHFKDLFFGCFAYHQAAILYSKNTIKCTLLIFYCTQRHKLKQFISSISIYLIISSLMVSYLCIFIVYQTYIISAKVWEW